MNNYQKLIEFHSTVLKAERCFELLDSHLDITYVENEESLRSLINTALSTCGEVQDSIRGLIECYGAGGEADFDEIINIYKFLRVLAKMLVQANMALFDDFIIGFDIIKKYHMNEV